MEHGASRWQMAGNQWRMKSESIFKNRLHNGKLYVIHSRYADIVHQWNRAEPSSWFAAKDWDFEHITIDCDATEGKGEEEGWRGTPQWKIVNDRKAKICIPLFWAFCGDSPCYRSSLAMDFSVQINFIPASEETSVWQAVVFEFFIRTSFSNGLVLRSVKIGWTWVVYKRNYTVKYSHLDWPIIACKPSEIEDLINYWLMYDVKSDWLVILSRQWSPLLYLSW